MSKFNLKATLISDEDNLVVETTGIKNKNKIIYKENNITVTILVYNNKIKMNRCSNEYNIDFIFEKDKNTMSSYKLFGMNKEFLLNTYTNKLVIAEELIEINYNLEGNNFYYKLTIGGNYDNR